MNSIENIQFLGLSHGWDRGHEVWQRVRTEHAFGWDHKRHDFVLIDVVGEGKPQIARMPTPLVIAETFLNRCTEFPFRRDFLLEKPQLTRQLTIELSGGIIQVEVEADQDLGINLETLYPSKKGPKLSLSSALLSSFSEFMSQHYCGSVQRMVRGQT